MLYVNLHSHALAMGVQVSKRYWAAHRKFV